MRSSYVWGLTLVLLGLTPLLANGQGEASQKGWPLRMPEAKPLDRPMSAAMSRLYDVWNPLGDYENEFYTIFKYSRLKGIGKDPEVSRRDPSKVVKVGGTYYVWYTRRKTEHPPVGLSNYTDDMPDDIPAWDWDLADIYYATSKDGFNWEEQGVAVARNIGGDYANRSLSTPDILCLNGKYYLYYQAFTGRFSRERGDRGTISMAWADAPDGPWTRIDRPIIELGEAGTWDSGTIHDPYPVIYKGQIWLYYKSDVAIEQLNQDTPTGRLRRLVRMHGVAMADKPEGPFQKSEMNPISNSGHETTLFPYGEGMVSIIIKDGPEKNTIQYAPDGLNFEIKSLVTLPPVAGAPFCPDIYTGNGDGRGITWGLCHIVGNGPGFLLRFDCDLSRDVDRPRFREGTVQANEEGHFTGTTTLNAALRQEILGDARTADPDTIMGSVGH